ncbi:HAD-IA family hydrolase [uncultured Brachyspira sp.]|uniref:HAD-IA family hydrolase n=1 Tax=uncultured Brachyspira sp. TaxID=221953 RepID=UPI00261EF1DB|nr:HAD-IA family hydrolase [uncultured Brachyspira sp.]
MIKNIISDIGNVLYEFIVDDFVNTYIDKEDREFFVNNTFNSKDWILMDKGVVSFEDSRKHFIKVCSKYEEVINKIFDTALTICLNKDNNNIHLLREYHNKGYNIYYLSNMPMETFNFLRKDTDFFDTVCIGGVISGDVKMVKPEKSIFEYFLNKFNVKAEECLFIDDNLNNVNAALELGIKSVHLKKVDDMPVILEDMLK